MKQIEKDNSLAEELAFYDFEEQVLPHLILQDGSLVSGLEVGLLDIECFDANNINFLTERMRSSLNSLSEGLTVQFYFTVDSEYKSFIDQHANSVNSKIDPIISDIAIDRFNLLRTDLENQNLYRPTLYVFLRSKMENEKSYNFFSKQGEITSYNQKSYEDNLDNLKLNLEQLKTEFSSLGVNSKILSSKDAIALIYNYLNPSRSKEIEPPNINESEKSQTAFDADWLLDQSPREQLVFGDLILELNQFILDSKAHKIISLKTLPEVTFAGQLSNFLRMPFHYDLILSFSIPKQLDEMNRLNQKRKMAYSLAQTKGQQASDLESETKLNSTEELIRELLSTGQRIYAMEMLIILKETADDEGLKRLSRNSKDVLSRFRSLQGAEGLEESVGAWKIFKNDMILAPVNLIRARKIKTNNLADFIPLYGPSSGDQNPVVVFRNRLNGLVGYDPYDSGLTNYNILVTGSSGAGKSFLNNCILSQELYHGLKVYIIDIGGSYKKLTQALSGQYLDINLSSEYAINPFHIVDINTGPSSQKIKTLLTIIELMVSDSDHSKFSKLESVLLEKEITDLYYDFKRHKRSPTLSDFKKKLELSSNETLKNIAQIISMWSGDTPYGKILDTTNYLEENAPICTFDLKGLSHYPDLQSVMTLILTDFILTQVETNKSQKKRIILDEAWQLLKSPESASFMEYCARTLRKTGSGITFITQGVEEIKNSPIGSAILNNTATKFVLLQTGDSKVLQDALKLNDQETHLVSTLTQKKGLYSEALLLKGDRRQVIRIIPTPIEYWLSTSDAKDNSYLESLINAGSTLHQSIKKASLDYPFGVNQGFKGDQIEEK